LHSGETVDLRDRQGCFDFDAGNVWGVDPVWDIPLSEVKSIRVGVAPEVIPPAVLPVSSVSSDSLKKLNVGQRVRLKAGSQDADWLAGTFVAYQDDVISLQNEHGTLFDVADNEIHEFQISEGYVSNKKSGATIGAITGGLLCGAAAGALAGTSMGPGGGHSDSGDIGVAIFAGVLAGALSGGLIGSLVGSASGSEQFMDLEEFDKPGLTDGPDEEWVAGYSIAF